MKSKYIIEGQQGFFYFKESDAAAVRTERENRDSVHLIEMLLLRRFTLRTYFLVQLGTISYSTSLPLINEYCLRMSVTIDATRKVAAFQGNKFQS